jgi:hypothetical protein
MTAPNDALPRSRWRTDRRLFVRPTARLTDVLFSRSDSSHVQGGCLAAFQTARRRTSHTVKAMSSTDNPSSQPASTHWNAQKRAAGW